MLNKINPIIKIIMVLAARIDVKKIDDVVSSITVMLIIMQYKVTVKNTTHSDL
jgi:hypothetical protein